MEQITIESGRASAIYFPAGKIEDGGSCDFQTVQCAKECHIKPNPLSMGSLKRFQELNVSDICNQITKEMKKDNIEVLSWFEAGDCPKLLTSKISQVMGALPENIIQHGFTRNKVLWDIMLDLKRVRLAYSCEDMEYAKRMSEYGLVGYPHYDSERVEILWKEKSMSMCGGGGISCYDGFSTDDDEIFPDDCHLCYENNRGCFIEYTT